MTKPSPTDATTTLDAARKAVQDYIMDIFEWRSAMMRIGNTTEAAEAWELLTNVREVSDKLDQVAGVWRASVDDPRESQVDKPVVAVAPYNRSPNKPTTRLRIELPDRSVLQEDTAAATLVEFIRWVGVERVKDLNFSVNQKPFISKVPLPTYSEASWKPIGSYFVETHSDTNKKRRLIMRIANSFNLRIVVTVVSD
jgi:hypothetical protein